MKRATSMSATASGRGAHGGANLRQRPSGRFSIANFIDERGVVRFDDVAETFRMSKAQLAETAGLGRQVLQKSSRRDGPKAQSRVREMLEIISLVQGWAGSPAQAMAWYRAEPIPAFG